MEDLISYDRIAEAYSRERIEFQERERPYFQFLLEKLEPGSLILDVGCGTGIPIARYYTENGHKVVGIDLSSRLLELARSNVPSAEFYLADMLTFEPGRTFSALVAWDSVFHVVPSKHSYVYAKFREWLMPDGWLITSLGGIADTFTAPMFGHDFYFGGLDPKESRELMERLGFKIITWEEDDPSSRGHIAVLAQVRNQQT